MVEAIKYQKSQTRSTDEKMHCTLVNLKKSGLHFQICLKLSILCESVTYNALESTIFVCSGFYPLIKVVSFTSMFKLIKLV